MADLEDTINQAISDFNDIEKAIEEQGIDVPYDTNTSQYGNLIRSIKQPIKYVESPDKATALDLFSMESGTYVLYGYFKPHPEATNYLTFSKLQLVSISKGSVSTCVQVFYPPYNTIQYLNILPPDEEAGTGYTYERKDAKLYYMEDTRNMTNTVDENSDDTHYPSAKAVYDAMELKRIESLDKKNMKYMRDIENGYYIMHGYFKPYPNSDSTVIMDTMCVSVVKADEGSHLMAFSPLNFKIRCYEILVDDTAADGFVFNSWVINLLELQELITKVGDIETALDSIIAIQNTLIGGETA